MVDTPSTPPLGDAPPAPIFPADKPHKGPTSFEYKPMTFLGMHFTADEAKKLWNIMIQNINQQIQKDKDKAIKAIRKMNPEHANDDS